MTFDNYLMFMTCVLITLFVIGCTIFLVWCIWNNVIEPIMDRIKSQRDDYWETKYETECDEHIETRQKLRRIGFDDGFINCIDPCKRPRVSQEYTDENTRSGCVDVMVKFSMLEDELRKYKEEQDKIFGGER